MTTSRNRRRGLPKSKSKPKSKTGPSSATALPSLPIELVEAILVHVPLRFALASLTGQDKTIHETCASAFAAVSLPTSCLAVFVPRFLNGSLKLIANKRFGVPLIHRLYEHSFPITDRIDFAAALEHNRVDYLDWWAFTAKLPAPSHASSKQHGRCRIGNLIQYAARHKAWDSLAWLARTTFLERTGNGMSDEELCDLVEQGGQEGIQLVEVWLRSKAYVWIDPWEVAIAACRTGCLSVLEALRDGHGSSMGDDAHDTAFYSCAAAVQEGHTHVLEWLHEKMACPLHYIPELACKNDRLDVLEWYKANQQRVMDPMNAWVHNLPNDDFGDPKRPYDAINFEVEFCLNQASIDGHIHLLDWLLDNGPVVVPYVYSCLAMDGASRQGHVQVLKWWHSRAASKGLALRYSDQSLLSATRNNHYPVLEWWVKESGLELRYDVNEVLRQAFLSRDAKGCVDWWLHESGLGLDVSQCTGVTSKCDHDTFEVLRRWNQLGRPLPCNVSQALYNAARGGRLGVLDWWKQCSGIPLVFDHQLMDAASSGDGNKNIEAMEWVCQLHAKCGLDLQYSEAALDDIKWPWPWGKQALAVVKWWLKSGHPLKYSDHAFTNAILALASMDEPDDADWWLRESGLPVRYTAEGVRAVLEKKRSYPNEVVATLKWMLLRGLELKVTADECKKADGSFLCQELEEYFATFITSSND